MSYFFIIFLFCFIKYLLIRTSLTFIVRKGPYSFLFQVLQKTFLLKISIPLMNLLFISSLPLNKLVFDFSFQILFCLTTISVHIFWYLILFSPPKVMINFFVFFLESLNPLQQLRPKVRKLYCRDLLSTNFPIVGSPPQLKKLSQVQK